MPKKDELRADAVTLVGLFQNDKEFNAPLFQRRYVWGSDQLSRFWSDLDQILDAEDSSVFLGAIVLEDVSTGLAFDPASYWVIDGQQRLSTLFMTLCAIANACRAGGREDFASEVTKKYLLNQGKKQAGKPKIRPTNRDLHQFATIVSSIPDANPESPFGDADGKMADAWKAISREVKRRAADQDGLDVMEKMATVILENLYFVQIILSEDHDPHQVFDSLNTAGSKLTNMDLIRNEVFKGFKEDPAQAEKLYNTRWLHFENMLGSRLDSYLFPFTLIHQPSAKKSQVFSILQKRWSGQSPLQIIDDLEAYTQSFNALSTDAPLELSVGLADALKAVRRMNIVASVYPYLMQVLRASLDGKLPQSLAADNFRLIEGFLVRRSFAGYEPTGLHAVFKDLWNKTEGNPEEMLKQIDAAKTVHFPDDEQFRSDILTKPLYSRRLAPFIIREYERGIVGGDPLPDGVALTIDHVMPQELTEPWKNVVAEDAHKALKDTWGNLVPLSQPFNSQKGQKLWGDIRSTLKTESIYKTTRKLADEYEEWNADTIKTRSGLLADWAVTRWPRKGHPTA